MFNNYKLCISLRKLAYRSPLQMEEVQPDEEYWKNFLTLRIKEMCRRTSERVKESLQYKAEFPVLQEIQPCTVDLFCDVPLHICKARKFTVEGDPFRDLD